MNDIPDLCGQVCESLIRQDYWYEGEKCEGVHLLFLKVVGGNWHRFHFDCGPLFWREVSAPDVWDTTRNYEFHYEQNEVGQQQGLVGIAIEKIVHNDSTSRFDPEVVIHFSNGTNLVLRDFCEYQTLRFETQTSK